MWFVKKCINRLKGVSLKTKVFFAFIIMMAVLVYQVSFSTHHHVVEIHGQQMVNEGLQTAQRRLDEHIRFFESSFNNLVPADDEAVTSVAVLEKLYVRSQKWQTRLRPDMVFYVDGQGFWVYSDEKNYAGQAGQSLDKDFRSLHCVELALKGESSCGFEILPSSLVRQTGLLSQAAVLVAKSVDAVPSGYSREERALVLVSSVPVKTNGVVTGAIAGVQVFNNRFDLVDMMNRDHGLKATIFLDNIRVSTSVFDEAGKRAVGTLLSAQVEEEVLKKGRNYYGRAFVVNDWYITAYQPIRDLGNRVIGALYVGLQEAPLVETQKALNNEIRLTVIVLTTIFSGILFYLYRSIVIPVQKMSSAAMRFARGDMTVRLEGDSLNECWEIKNCEYLDCPVYGKPHLKCWLVPKTVCCGETGSQVDQVCERCSVYKRFPRNEVDQLMDSFNFMAASIQEYTNSLETLNNELEKKNCELVDQRDEMECQKEQLIALNRELEESLKALDDSQSIIYAMAVAVEAKDPYTRGHSERVAEYSMKLGIAIGLPTDDLEVIRGAALMHDIGKIGISGSILRKPGQLTAMEYHQVKKHPVIGDRICSSLKFARDLVPIIMHHHEHYDGSGYPDGLKGEKIPLMARVVAIADAFDAMTSDRPYRSGMSQKEALDILEKGAGSQWDPVLVPIFMELLRGDHEQNALQYKSTDTAIN